MKTTMINMLLVLFVFYCGTLAFLFFKQNSFIFFSTGISKNQEFLLRQFSHFEVNINHNGFDLHGWFINREFSPEHPLIIYYGGNAEEISKYLKGLKPDQLKGLVSSITGKYHELRYEMFINSQDNNLRAELFDEYNHPGSDIKLINTETGEVREFQLKATNYKSYLNKHIKKYEDIEILATEEVAADAPDIGSTGFYNKDLREEVEDTLDKAEGSFIGSEVLSSMTVSAMIILARKLKVILKTN